MEYRILLVVFSQYKYKTIVKGKERQIKDEKKLIFPMVDK